MDKRVQQVVHLIENDLNHKKPFFEMARSVNLSYSRLRHLFRSEVGMSLEHYRKLLQMLRAKELLETTFLQVKEISSKVGIGDESHFVRDFKRTFGFSPTQYRSRLNNAQYKMKSQIG
jgi:AraC family transcriptional regulator of arabinose operon